jgi:hypothetical protein
MNKIDFLKKLGFQDGVSDHDNKEPNLYLTASAIDYGNFYLEGYKKGYEIASTKSWYMVGLDKVTNKTNNYLIDLGDKGNDWTHDKEKATKFPTRESVTERLRNFSCGRGNYGMTWE